MKIEELHIEIVRQLEKRADEEIASKTVAQAEYFGIKCRSYGLKEDDMIAIKTKYQSNFEQLGLEERFKLIRIFYNSRFSEQIGLGDTLLKLSLNMISPAHYAMLDEIAGCFKNWGETDWFCSRIIQPLLLRYPEETIKILRKWNRSDNMWKRRISVVTFTRKIGESGRFTDEALQLCDNIIRDKEDLVRKGIGWALKDTMRGSKKKVLDYIKSLRRRGVSSTITLYAIRDLKGKEREDVLNIKPKTKIKE